MYEILSRISGWLSQPFTAAAYHTEFGLLAALMFIFWGISDSYTYWSL